MILMKIFKASEVVASKVGQIIEKLSSDRFDNSALEDQVIIKMLDSLAAEGLNGENSAENDVGVDSEQLALSEGLKVRVPKKF